MQKKMLWSYFHSSLNYDLTFIQVWIKELLRWAVRRRQWHPTPVLLPGKSHGRRSLVGCKSAGSGVVGQQSICPAARGILPDQGLNWCRLHCKVDFQPLDHQGLFKQERAVIPGEAALISSGSSTLWFRMFCTHVFHILTLHIGCDLQTNVEL